MPLFNVLKHESRGSVEAPCRDDAVRRPRLLVIGMICDRSNYANEAVKRCWETRSTLDLLTAIIL